MSGWRVGDWVEVRQLGEVLATLDSRGCLAGLPFMPEMAKFCGGRFRIVKSAHKTCDPTGQTNMRRMSDAVHLATRCDGSGHDGCEARCLLYWKTAWLKPAGGPAASRSGIAGEPNTSQLTPLASAAFHASNNGTEIRYRCQATEIVSATTCLSSKDPKQYIDDLSSRNVPIHHFIRYFGRALCKSVASRLTRPRAKPVAALPPGAVTKSPSLGLKPGDLVRIRSAEEILLTLDDNGKNRGLALENEMLWHCGKIGRVAHRVHKIIDEKTGRMLGLENDCIVLEGLVCGGLENRGRLFCPRSSYFYWREAWLRRAPDEAHAAGNGADRSIAAPENSASNRPAIT